MASLICEWQLCCVSGSISNCASARNRLTAVAGWQQQQQGKHMLVADGVNISWRTQRPAGTGGPMWTARVVLESVAVQHIV
jgi:hypothetical protein